MMKDFITSKEIVEMFVIMLLDGKSGKVAVQKDENSPTEFKQMSILTQFLNPNMKRKCMTNSIKDTLVRTTKLLLKNEANANKTNVYDKVLLFIFSLTGIDLSYIDIYYEQERIDKLLKIIEAILSLFCGKDPDDQSRIYQVDRSRIYETVYGLTNYTAMMKEDKSEETGISLSPISFIRIMINQLESNGIKDQLQGMCSDDFSSKYDYEYPLIDFEHKVSWELLLEHEHLLLELEQGDTLDDLFSLCKYEDFDSLSEFNELHSLCEYTKVTIDLTEKLLKSKDYKSFMDSIDSDYKFKTRNICVLIEKIHNLPESACFEIKSPDEAVLAIRKSDLISKKTFKADIFQWIYSSLFDIFNHIMRKLPYYMLYKPTLYIRVYRILSLSLKKVDTIEKQYLKGRFKRQGNEELFKNEYFRKFTWYLKECRDYCDFQIRMRLKFGTLGCFRTQQVRCENNKPHDIRSFIRVMIDFLFQGVKNKAGKEISDEEHPNWKYKLVRSDLIAKYLNGEHDTFTVKIRDALYNQVRYYLYPGMQHDSSYNPISAELFMELMWQFFYSAFDIDFYMLKTDLTIQQFDQSLIIKQEIIAEAWDDIIYKLLTAAINYSDITTLQIMTKQLYYHYQISIDKKDFRRFLPEELTFCCEQETLIVQNSNNDYEHVKNVLSDSMYEEMISKIVFDTHYSKLEALISRISNAEINNAFKFLSELLKIQTPQKYETYWKNSRSIGWREVISSNDNQYVNWKEKVLVNSTWIDERTSDPRSLEVTKKDDHILPLDELRDLFNKGIGILNDCFQCVIPYNGYNIFEIPQVKKVLSLKDTLWDLLTKFTDLYYKLYSEMTTYLPHDKNNKERTENNKLNLELLHSGTVQMVYQTIRNAYLYILYQQHVSSILKIK